MRNRLVLLLIIITIVAFTTTITLLDNSSRNVKAAIGTTPDPFPAEVKTFRTFSALATDQDRLDFQILARFIEHAAEDISNVAHALVRNEVVGVAGVEYTQDQITAIQNAGLAAAWEMKEGYLALIAHAGVTPAQLDIFAINNPNLIDAVPLICANDVTVCPGYVPPVATPIP